MYGIKDIFKHFCKTSAASNQQLSERSSEDKLNETYDICENEPLSDVPTVATSYFIPQTTVHQIMTDVRRIVSFKESTAYINQCINESGSVLKL